MKKETYEEVKVQRYKILIVHIRLLFQLRKLGTTNSTLNHGRRAMF